MIFYMKMIEKLIATALKQWSYVQQQFHATNTKFLINMKRRNASLFNSFF